MERHRATPAAVVKPLSFDPPRLLAALKRSGYAHVAADTDENLLIPFIKEHRLILCEHSAYTITLRMKVVAAETPEEKAARFEKIRVERNEKKLKAAVKKKEKESKS